MSKTLEKQMEGIENKLMPETDNKSVENQEEMTEITFIKPSWYNEKLYQPWETVTIPKSIKSAFAGMIECKDCDCGCKDCL